MKVEVMMKRETAFNIQNTKLSVPISKRDHIQGSLEAPLALVEYADYECPYCGEAYANVKAVQERLGDQLCFAFRNFPLVEMHPHAEPAAEAAESAGAQDKFWEMHDLLFENQEALEDDNLIEYARAIDLDVPRFVRDLESNAHLPRIQEDFASGARSGVQGTPTFFINGVRHEGEYDPDTLIGALTKAAEAGHRT
jgi:protein-disulfide isomerase